MSRQIHRNNIPTVEEVTKDRQRLNVHDEYQHLPVDRLQQINANDAKKFAVCVINLHGDLNTGMIIRTACCLGAERVILFGHRRFDRRSTVGAHNYIPVERVDGVVDDQLSLETFEQLRTRHQYYPLLIEQGGHDIRFIKSWRAYASEQAYRHYIDSFDHRLKPLLVFGNETNGIPRQFIERYSDTVFSIQQCGVIRSLNVSAAASIAIWALAG